RHVPDGLQRLPRLPPRLHRGDGAGARPRPRHRSPHPHAPHAPDEGRDVAAREGDRLPRRHRRAQPHRLPRRPLRAPPVGLRTAGQSRLGPPREGLRGGEGEGVDLMKGERRGAKDERTRETPLAERVADAPAGARRYAVRAVWRTLQGGGAWAGRAAVFVRFAGCNLWTGEEEDRARGLAPCSQWCDTDFRKAGSARLSAGALADEVLRVAGGDEPIRFCVLTGGEPLLQADAALVGALHEAGCFVAVET